ncbi:hypothetical protein BKA65DRAFT_534615 [Rhexocercosporidium sp. MPI-PUGE-AT-0058]|nr:hypothetical protein BKA65DRAFT_534615 [Rhexocercosporidium sp. MPI-PUGE-AT-0058]
MGYSIEVVRSWNARIAQSQPLVAVFTGSTAGIGEHSVRALAAAHGKDGKGLRAYIIGRNEASGTRVISECLNVCPAGQFRFIRANDLALLKDVDRVSAEIIRLEEIEVKSTGGKAKIDLLVMSHAFFAIESRRDTTEGLDAFMSHLYYSRARFTIQLMPLLLESSLPARVVSVFGPGRDVKLIPDDLSLRDPRNYSFMNMGSHAAYFMTFFFERMASQYPGRLSLTHYYPGLVLTDAFTNGTMSSKLITWTFRIISPFIRPFTVSQMESGNRVIFHTSPRFPARSASAGGEQLPEADGDLEIAISSDGVVGGGAYRGSWNGDVVPLGKAYADLRQSDIAERCWSHTMQAFEEIEAGRVFTA